MTDRKALRVLVLGAFDVLHYGHFEFLNRAKQYGTVIIGLGTDEFQASVKRRPVQDFGERCRALRALGFEVAGRDQLDIRNLVSVVRPDVMVLGSDWFGKNHLERSGVDIDWVVMKGIDILYVPRNHPMSTSELLGRAGTV